MRSPPMNPNWILLYKLAPKSFGSLWTFDDERLMLRMAGFKKECAENIYREGRNACEFEHRGRRQRRPSPLGMLLIRQNFA